MSVYCDQCRHYIPWGQRPGSTEYHYNPQEECAAHPIEETRPGSPVHPPLRVFVNAICREKNGCNNCADFEPKPSKRPWWARLLGIHFGLPDCPRIPPPPHPRLGFNPPPVENVVKPPAPPLPPHAIGVGYRLDPERGKMTILETSQVAVPPLPERHFNVPLPDGAVMPKIKPPPEPTGFPACSRCKRLERQLAKARKALEDFRFYIAVRIRMVEERIAAETLADNQVKLSQEQHAMAELDGMDEVLRKATAALTPPAAPEKKKE